MPGGYICHAWAIDMKKQKLYCCLRSIVGCRRPRLSPEQLHVKVHISQVYIHIQTRQRKASHPVSRGRECSLGAVAYRGGSTSIGPCHINTASPLEGALDSRRSFSWYCVSSGRRDQLLRQCVGSKHQPSQTTNCSRKHGTRSFTLAAMNHRRSSSSSSTYGASASAAVPGASPCRAFIALGSNQGDRIAAIEQACREMEACGIRIIRTSSLFETAPMYVTDQESFFNGVCEIETTLGPTALLNTLQSIETGMGRRKIIDKGPRNIDLDILLYNNLKFSDPRLDIPHKLMLEREFVLRPLCQLIPKECPPLSDKKLSYQSYLESLPPSNPPPVAVTPLSPHLPPLNPSDPTRTTHLMAVLNVTPDSFSDGGQNSPANLAALAETIRTFIRNGATIIDVGGESTRPDSVPVAEQEELSRVIPAIRLIRSLPEANKIAISIDTYRAAVAEAAVNAGADIINDVSAGAMDPNMPATMAKLQKTVMLMHMRGTPQTMTKLTDYSAYVPSSGTGSASGSGLINGVANELMERIRAVESAGVRRWRIILDPGIGFAKNQAQNLELLGNMHCLKEGYEGLRYFPWLVGTSRKGFIGRITGVTKPNERVWGTAAAVTAAVAGGADVVRVHDVEEMRQVVKMADAIYRRGD
ncbi:dihydropteroate synthase [Blastomyces gilchristii SLH14081]|uniref:Folic acid synthesis protein FOL1 n=1 Tax=Blastomyces gilchristii (strain SLH14081) TaxID=559298 RepID=A0A179UU04_BLAGS|nr:dihydropteroate synthase [Blastomyces gilchristii SLH14081]OAT11514.1 dihydropteroate synthase [Blastomyces gilchristii SLH14081]